MATKRTLPTPYGFVHFEVEGETYITQSGVVNGDITAAVGGVTEIPNPLHQLDYQYATIQAHKLNGVLQS